MAPTKVITKRLALLAPLVLLMLCFSSFAVLTRTVTHTVEISRMQFVPAELTVKKGDKVVFINRDIVTHDVTEKSGKSWKSPALVSGKSWSMVVTKNQAYFCSYHPVMKGKILVK